MNLALWLERAGKAFPDNPAVALGAKVVQSYGTLSDRASRLAGGLKNLGLKPGDRVAICSKNQPEYVEAMYGLWWGAFSIVPTNAKLHGAEINYILEDSGAKACLVEPELEGLISQQAPNNLKHLIVFGRPAYEKLFAGKSTSMRHAEPNDLAWLFYTSGTTGPPKGAVVAHRRQRHGPPRRRPTTGVRGRRDAIPHAPPPLTERRKRARLPGAQPQHHQRLRVR